MHDWKNAKSAMTNVPLWYRYRLLALIFGGFIFFFGAGVFVGVLFSQ